jgi:hypothetical protein
MDDLVRVLLGLVLLLLFTVPLGAILLRLAVKLLMKFDAPFGQACLAVFLVLIASRSIALLFKVLFVGLGIYGASEWTVSLLKLGLLFVGSGIYGASGWIVSLFSLAIHFFVGSRIYGAMVKHPQSAQPIGFRKAMPISLVTLLIDFAFGFVLRGIIMVWWFLSPGM